MKLGDLSKFGIPDRVLENWLARQGEVLLPVQSRAIKKGLLGDQSRKGEEKSIRMIISAPTSSGKSFCAELAVVKSLTSRKKAVVLFPLKALANQKYEQFQKVYGPLGIKTILVSGDHPENDRRFLRGDYDIALCIYEKFNRYLTASIDALKTIGLVVVDEIQTIADPSRGAVLENILTKLKVSSYESSLVSLSAVIGDENNSAGRLAEWLDAELIEEQRRPVELVRGVAAGGTFKYKLFNLGLEGSEPFADADSGDDLFDAFVEQIKKDDGSTIVFLKSRMETVEFAIKMASKMNRPEAKEAIASLASEEPSFLIRSLRQALSRGVAFHNADLSSCQRSVIEKAFVKKEVKVLFSTTTLAMGVNLSADNVYLETVKYSGGRYTGRPQLVPVSRSEFDNMSGRAGRYDSRNIDEGKQGKAVVLARSEFDRDILWDNYIASENNEELDSALGSLSMADWILEMVATGLLKSNDKKAFERLFGMTLYGTINRSPWSDYESAYLYLEQNGFIESRDNDIFVTSLGQASVKTGLSVTDVGHFQKQLNRYYPESRSGWLAMALGVPSMQLPASILNYFELRQNGVLKLLYRSYDHLIADLKPFINIDRPRQLDYREASLLKLFLLLEEWRSLTELGKLEERFQIHLGQIIHLAETAAHLINSLGEIVAVEDNDHSLKNSLSRLSFSVRFGLPLEMEPIHRELGEMLNRSDFIRLYKSGVKRLEDLLKLSDEQLRAVIVGEAKCKYINEKITKLKEEVQMDSRTDMRQNQSGAVLPVSFLEPEMIEIEGTYERERYLVKINGFPVRLTGKSFKYFTKLAWSRLYGDSGWVYKEEIEHGFNQARYLYRMKGEISQGLNSNWDIFENNRLGYYRLNADPAKIKINIDNLKDHPDFEIRSLVENGQFGTIN